MTSIGWLADDPVLKQLHTVIQCGWPERKSDVPMCLRPYFDLREELVVQGCAAPDELSMSYTSANVGVSFKTKLSTTWRCACVGRKEMAPKLKNYYDRHVKPLNPINLGESVRVRLPGEKVWSPAECVGFAGPRSYLLKTGDAVYRRNHRAI